MFDEDFAALKIREKYHAQRVVADVNDPPFSAILHTIKACIKPPEIVSTTEIALSEVAVKQIQCCRCIGMFSGRLVKRHA